jgi:hypothetical protein
MKRSQNPLSLSKHRDIDRGYLVPSLTLASVSCLLLSQFVQAAKQFFRQTCVQLLGRTGVLFLSKCRHRPSDLRAILPVMPIGVGLGTRAGSRIMAMANPQRATLIP